MVSTSLKLKTSGREESFSEKSSRSKLGFSASINFSKASKSNFASEPISSIDVKNSCGYMVIHKFKSKKETYQYRF